MTLRSRDRFDIIRALMAAGDERAPALLKKQSEEDKTDDARRYAYSAGAAWPDAATKKDYFAQYAGDKELAEREKAIVEKEHELAELRAKAISFPKELEAAVNQAVKEVTDRLKLEAKNREDLLVKQFEGERNVLAAKNDSLEKTNKDLLTANAKLAQQLEAAYQKVQDIAEKTVEGTSQSKSLADLQKLLIEQSRKGREEKT